MGEIRDELNIGQLCREHFGREAALIGFGTHTGTVTCASDWDGPTEMKPVTPSLAGSYEHLSHETGIARFLLELGEHADRSLLELLGESRLQRFIGVIYRPETERWSHYMEAMLPRQYDAWVWFDETSAVSPLPTRLAPGEEETWPWGYRRALVTSSRVPGRVLVATNLPGKGDLCGLPDGKPHRIAPASDHPDYQMIASCTRANMPGLDPEMAART